MQSDLWIGDSGLSCDDGGSVAAVIRRLLLPAVESWLLGLLAVLVSIPRAIPISVLIFESCVCVVCVVMVFEL